MLNELRYRKLRNGMWQAYDRNGNTAEGITKDIAEGQYNLLYCIKMPTINSPEVDINSKYVKEVVGKLDF